MPTHTKIILTTALCLPLLLSGCDSGSDAGTSKASASPHASATLPVQTAYVVAARKGVSDTDLRAAVPRFAKMRGVAGASVTGHGQLRVDLTGVDIYVVSAKVIAELRKLGTVSAPQ